MPLIYELVTPPTSEPVVLTDLKGSLRIDHDADDSLILRLGVVARRFIERRLSVALVEQTWRLLHQGALEGPLTLRPGPVQSVSSVNLRYGESAFQPTTDWQLIRTRPATFDLSAPCSFNGERLTEVEILYTTGAPNPVDVPEDLVQAILMLTAHYYENREAVLEGRYVTMPLAVEALLQPHQEARL